MFRTRQLTSDSRQLALRAYLADAKRLARSAVGSMLRPVGFDLIRIYKLPRETFLGLGHLPIRTIIDVGANRGQFAREVVRFFPHARLICFEPLEPAALALRRWAQSVPQEVIVVEAALGDQEGMVPMQVHLDWETSSSLLHTSDTALRLYPFQKRQATIEVPLTTLDAYVARSSTELQPDVLVKIDAQGYDDRVIRGAARTLQYARACIVEINLDQLYQTQGSFKDVFVLLDKMGYRYRGNLDQAYAADGHVAFIDAVFVR